ncbi:hypothetical protein [Sediminimonas sp.]|uniref:hypothetical protein n=1 Tax=Sediminimonas sp. TaxID=2823379 RepID=UPI0025DDB3C5|nr:hypothetical protein [Sediminimonas sp.]
MADQIAIIDLPVRDKGPRAAGQVKLVDDARLELRIDDRVFVIGMDELQHAMIRAALARMALEQAGTVEEV